MGRFVSGYFLILVIAGLVKGQVPQVKADDNRIAEEEIKKLEFRLADLIMKRELDTYATYLADDYIRMDALGGVMTKEQVLEEMKAAKPGKMMPENLRVRIYGETAILNGELTTKREGEQKVVTRKALFTKVFLKRGDRWYLVNNQGTLVSEQQVEK